MDFDFSDDKPDRPLEAMNVDSPLDIAWVIPFRATGDFLTYLEANPDTDRAQIERYLVATYPPETDLEDIVDKLLEEADVEYAYVPLVADYVLPAASEEVEPLGGTPAPTQYWITAMNFAGAWALAGGWGLVGTLDNGLQTNHPDLVPFSGTTPTGGNYLSVYSRDYARDYPGSPYPIKWDRNVDEREPVYFPEAAACVDQAGFMVPTFAGHGTHVAGLVAANHSTTQGITTTKGACKNCGIASYRISVDTCLPSGIVRPQPYSGLFTDEAPGSDIPGRILQVQQGVQVINQSFEYPTVAAARLCVGSFANSIYCKSIRDAMGYGVLQVGASGNRLTRVAFPAHEPEFVAVGGLNESLSFWDDSPNCPLPPPSLVGCGSNYTIQSGERKQELTVAAKRVLSTIYQSQLWNASCADNVDGTSDDGQGPCTGTSMSSPVAAGMFGLLRSINPLVLPGDPETTTTPIGVRDVVVQSSSLATSWDPELGYGTPNVGLAAATMLGTVDAAQVKNRVTPLFTLYNSALTDWAAVAVPQAAIAMIRQSANAWTPSRGEEVPGYAAFPRPINSGSLPAPRAIAYALTTEFKPVASYPDLVPLYWFDRVWYSSSGCDDLLQNGCTITDQDHLLTTATSTFSGLLSAGYRYRGRQGYVYQTCSPEPMCIPPGTEKLYRKCKSSANDCAVFLESDRSTFEFEGYTTAIPSGSNTMLGYAYSRGDVDPPGGDGLVDAMERLIGTSTNLADSDCDGTNDAIEFPLAGVYTGDPLGATKCTFDLSVAVDVPPSTNPTVTVSNLGPGNATNVSVKVTIFSLSVLDIDPFPGNCTYQDGGATVGSWWILTCPISSILNGQNSVRSWTIGVAGGGSATLWLSAEILSTDSNTTNNTANDYGTIGSA